MESGNKEKWAYGGEKGLRRLKSFRSYFNNPSIRQLPKKNTQLKGEGKFLTNDEQIKIFPKKKVTLNNSNTLALATVRENRHTYSVIFH